MVIGALAGAGLGCGWYPLAGGSTGTTIDPSPLSSTLYGLILGVLVAGSFQ